MVQAEFWASLSKAGEDIAVESWVSKFRPYPRYSYLPYLLFLEISNLTKNIYPQYIKFLIL